MHSTRDPALALQTVLDQIFALMHVQPDDAVKLCEQVFQGVESEAQVAFLHASMGDEIQGFHFSKPITADQFFELWGQQDPAAL